MLPHIHIFGLHLPTYAIAVGAGVLAFVALFIYYFRELLRTDRVTFNRLAFSVLLSIAALALFAYLFDGLFHSIEEGRLVFGGITWLGGVAGAFPAVLLFVHILVPKKRGYGLDVLDALMPGLAVAHGLGRVGCFFGGCCFGRVTDSALGVSFPEGSIAAERYPAEGGGSLPVLPTQLFEAGFELLLFLVLLILSRRTKRYNTAIWSVAYAVFRFSLEFFRGDDRGSAGFALSPAQVLSILLLIFGLGLILYRLGLAPHSLCARVEKWQQEADALPVTPYNTVSCKASDAEALRQLHSLRAEGVITEEEYERKKNEILERM